LRNLARPGDSDNQDEIRERQHSSANKVPPLLIVLCLIEERGQASNDENKVPDSTERNPYLSSSTSSCHIGMRQARCKLGQAW
jgi:hypothetical protein